MKKQFLATLTLLTAVVATASAEKNKVLSTASRTVTVQQQAKKLVVEGNVDVVLFENNSSTISIFGNEKNIQVTVVTEKNGVVTISNKKQGEKTLVYVPVKNISSIEADGNAKITSGTVLNSKEIILVANGDCNINIISSGKIEVLNTDGAETVVKKRNFDPRHEI